MAAESREQLAACVRAAGDWLAVGLDGRAERLAAYPWPGSRVPTLHELVAELAQAGVNRFVISHGGAEPDMEVLQALCRSVDAEVLIAGGVSEAATLSRLRDAGVTGVILGEALFTGAIDYPAAVAAAAA